MTQLSCSGLQGYRILQNRFALSKCLSVSKSGELYIAWDLTRMEHEGSGARVLVHLVPKSTLLESLTETKNRLTEIHDRFQDDALLPVTLCGEADESFWFSFPYPDGADVQALSTLHPIPKHIQVQTNQLFKLLNIQPPRAAFDPALILVGGSRICMVSTAFLPDFKRPIAQAMLLPMKPRVLIPVVAAIAGVAVASSVLLSSFFDKEKPLPATPLALIGSTIAPSMPQTSPMPLAMIPALALHEHDQLMPATNEAALTITPALHVDPLPAQAEQVSSKTQDKPAIVRPAKPAHTEKTDAEKNTEPATTKTKTLMVAVPAQNAEQPTKDALKNPDKPKPAHKAVVEAVVSVKKSAPSLKESTRNVSATHELAAADNAQITTTLPTSPETVGLTELPSVISESEGIDALINSAYQALHAGQLGDTPKQGVVYFLRQIKQQSSLHPQIQRIARDVVLARHQQVRADVQSGDAEAARNHLQQAGDAIREFNLKEMNQSHELLVHKLEQSL